MHKAHDIYNRRGMSNMQLNNGPHGAWAGACLTSSGVRPKNGLVRYPVQSRRGGAWEQSIYKRSSFSDVVYVETPSESTITS